MPQFGAQIDTLRIPIKGLTPEQSASALGTPTEGLLWHDTATKHVFVWLNGAWVQLDNVAGGVSDGDKGDIVVSSGGTVWTIDSGAVTSAKIADGTIVAGDLAPGTIPTTLPPSGAAGGDLGSTYPNPTVLKAQTGFTVQGAGQATATTWNTIGLNGLADALNVRVTSDTQPRFDLTAGGVLNFGDGATTPDTNLYRSGANALKTDDAFAAAGITSNGQIDATNHKVVNVTDPTNPQDAATKAYVDSVAQGLDPKASVKAASTANLTLSGAQTVDGISLVAGDRILVKNQTTVSQNGIYSVQGGGWVRTQDLDTWTEVPGAFTFVEQGTTQADTGWVSTADSGGTMDSTAMPWVQFSGAGNVGAGAGLTQAGTVLNVGAGAGIQVNADTVQVADNGITNAMLADGAVNLASADVTGTLPITKGGTGATTAAGARTALGGVPIILMATVPALPTPGSYVTVPGIVRPGGGAMGTVSVSFGYLAAGNTAASGGVFLDWRCRGTEEDFQVKADVAMSANLFVATVVMAA